jgi:tetratricopeptide (TPR) repeat protein
MRASRLIGRGDYAAAGSIYEQLIAIDASDAFATMMLSLCYERQNRVPEALRLAEEGARRVPSSLTALKSAVRLAIAVGEHDKATTYLRQALALPEVQTEIPRETVVPKPFLWGLRLLPKLPIIRNRIRHDAIRELEPGAQAIKLEEWKRWAQEYLAWRAGDESPRPDPRVH